MGKFDDSITTPKCGEYVITNKLGNDPDQLVIKKFVTNVENIYEFEEVLTTAELARDETYTLVISDTSIYSIQWLSDAADVMVILNTCYIDQCMLQYVNKLVCCDDCLACDDSCEGTEWLAKYVATDTLYVVLMDLINSHFGSTEIAYPYIASSYDTVHTLNDIMDKLDNLCSCTTC